MVYVDDVDYVDDLDDLHDLYALYDLYDLYGMIKILIYPKCELQQFRNRLMPHL